MLSTYLLNILCLYFALIWDAHNFGKRNFLSITSQNTKNEIGCLALNKASILTPPHQSSGNITKKGRKAVRVKEWEALLGTIFWTWHGTAWLYNCELTAAVVTSTRPTQDLASQNHNLDGIYYLQMTVLTEKFLAVHSCWRGTFLRMWALAGFTPHVPYPYMDIYGQH